MSHVDLSEFLTENDLVVEGLGPRPYVVPAPDAETGLKYNALSSVAVRVSRGEDVDPAEYKALALDDEEEVQFVVKILSQEVVDQMKEDGLPWPALSRTAQYAFTHFAVGADAAKKALAAGAFSGKAQAPNRATRRATPSTRNRASAATKKTRPAAPAKTDG